MIVDIPRVPARGLWRIRAERSSRSAGKLAACSGAPDTGSRARSAVSLTIAVASCVGVAGLEMECHFV